MDDPVGDPGPLRTDRWSAFRRDHRLQEGDDLIDHLLAGDEGCIVVSRTVDDEETFGTWSRLEHVPAVVDGHDPIRRAGDDHDGHIDLGDPLDVWVSIPQQERRREVGVVGRTDVGEGPERGPEDESSRRVGPGEPDGYRRTQGLPEVDEPLRPDTGAVSQVSDCRPCIGGQT